MLTIADIDRAEAELADAERLAEFYLGEYRTTGAQLYLTAYREQSDRIAAWLAWGQRNCAF